MRVRLQVQASFLALLLLLVALVPESSVLAQGIERINFPARRNVGQRFR